MKNIITFEEFKELVKERYLKSSEVITEEAAMEYFNSDEAQDYIKSEYENCVEDYNNGELNADCFRNGEVGKVAYNLFMMYE